MTTPTAGPTPSETLSAEAKAKRFDDRLAAFETGEAGLPTYGPVPASQEEALRLLALTGADRAKLSPEDCADAAVTLTQYAFHVHRACARSEAKANWAEEELGYVTAPHLGEQEQYTPAADKRRLVIRSNAHAQGLEGVRREARARADALAFLSQRIHAVAEAYRGLGIARKADRAYGS